MENMKIYDSVRDVPDTAKKQIGAGRLKGKTDINPMWRIQMLTEIFGPCGVGWKYTIDRQWTEPGANGEISAFCNISLYIKADGAWSDAIPGTGGSAFVAREKNGPYTSDECYKMALTDALSVACKALGVGADVYWSQGCTKYGGTAVTLQKAAADGEQDEPVGCMDCGQVIEPVKTRNGQQMTARQVLDMSLRRYGRPLCSNCMKKEQAARDSAQAEQDGAGGAA